MSKEAVGAWPQRTDAAGWRAGSCQYKDIVPRELNGGWTPVGMRARLPAASTALLPLSLLHWALLLFPGSGVYLNLLWSTSITLQLLLGCSSWRVSWAGTSEAVSAEVFHIIVFNQFFFNLIVCWLRYVWKQQTTSCASSILLSHCRLTFIACKCFKTITARRLFKSELESQSPCCI